ncbi:HinT-interacting membrane complex lipoprotein P60 [Mycoplasma phocimorsus]|uniref:HinT-interacting membrane complex lipoprotein P60 n=1 Tax=Mycoplasma phocimorsus TaxID=3045839 RepID=UPI0024C0E4D6|nr:hypothetical protein [Mycoplasma phocimorsus]MDJ1647199.1 hypothetical protein [Mycoplasma phocimorsus]
MKFRKILMLTPITMFPIITISCGKDVKTSERLEQEKKIEADKAFINNAILTKAIVADLYKKDINELLNEFNNENSKYFKNSYELFKIFAAYNLSTNSNFFAEKEEKEWSQFLNFDNIATPGVIPDVKRFKKYFTNPRTKIEFTINKMYLAQKYFLEENEEALKKASPLVLDYEIDLKNYNLINYLIKNKVSQQWSFVSSNNSDIYSKISEQISKLEDFNNFLIKETTTLNKSAPELLIKNSYNKSDIDESKLLGYQGFKNNGLAGFEKLNSIFSKEILLKEEIEHRTGFYDYNKEIIIPPNQLSENPIKIYNSKTKKFELAYINVFLPKAKKASKQFIEKVKKTDSKKYEKFTSYLTLDDIYSKEQLEKLSAILSIVDPELDKKVAEFFKSQGYKLDVLEEIFNEEKK